METKEFIEHIVSAGYEVRSYSGRGMYGKVCVGVECECLVEFVTDIMVSENDADTRLMLKDILDGLRQDSMGFDIIVYFPNMSIEEGDL